MNIYKLKVPRIIRCTKVMYTGSDAVSPAVFLVRCDPLFRGILPSFFLGAKKKLAFGEKVMVLLQVQYIFQAAAIASIVYKNDISSKRGGMGICVESLVT